MIIERATLADKDVLLDLMQKQFLEHEIPHSAGILEAAIREMITRDSLGIILVARDDDHVIGLAAIPFAWTLEHGGKSAWLDELYVLPEHRGAGVGGLLVDSVLVEAEKEGCIAVDLEVEAEHQRVEQLYARKGFRRLDRSRWVKQIK